MSDKIRDNKVKSLNNIYQDEHEDSADAKRVTLVDMNGDPVNIDISVSSGGKLVTEKFDDIVITRDPANYVITQLDYKFEGNLIATVVIERDLYLNITRAYRTL